MTPIHGATRMMGVQSRKTPLMARNSSKIGTTAFVGSLLAVSAALAIAPASRAEGTAYPRCPPWVSSPPAKASASVSYPPHGSRRRADEGEGHRPRHAGRRSNSCRPVRQRELLPRLQRGRAEPGTDLLVKGLLPDTAYRFRVVAKTRAGRRLRRRSDVPHARGRSRPGRGQGGLGRDRRNVERPGPRSPRPAARSRPPAELRRGLLEREPGEGRSPARPPAHVDGSAHRVARRAAPAVESGSRPGKRERVRVLAREALEPHRPPRPGSGSRGATP